MPQIQANDIQDGAVTDVKLAIPKVDKETWTALTFGSTVTYNTNNKQNPLSKLTATGSFTYVLQTLKDGASGKLWLTISTAGVVTMDLDDTTYTFKSFDNSTITDHS